MAAKRRHCPGGIKPPGNESNETNKSKGGNEFRLFILGHNEPRNRLHEGRSPMD